MKRKVLIIESERGQRMIADFVNAYPITCTSNDGLLLQMYLENGITHFIRDGKLIKAFPIER